MQINFKWEQRKLGDQVMLITKGTTPKDKSGMGSINFIKVEDLISDKITPQTHVHSEEHNNYLKRSRLRENDILFSIAGTLGRVALVKQDILPANTNQALAIIRGYKYNKNFLLISLNGNTVKKYIHANPTVGAQPNLSLKQVGELLISSPSEKEQASIGKLFKKMNHLFTLQQRKLEQLQLLKKAMLQQLFADKNCKQPILRFKNFNGNWEQRKLKDVSVFENGRAYKQNELLEKGKYPVLRVGNFYTNDQWYYSNLELAKNKYANNGDLLYTWSATFGPHIWNGPKIIYHYHIWKIQISNRISKLFLYSFLEADKANLLNNTNGSTMIHITKSNMENKAIIYPKMEEQLKIGGISSLIENLITLHQNKLSQLTTFKKYLLQKLFI